MITAILGLTLLAQGQKIQDSGQKSEGTAPVRQVAVLPWALKDGTDSAVKTAKEAVQTIFEKANFEVIPLVRTKTIWEEELHLPAVKEVIEDRDTLPTMPEAKDLLKLGKRMNVPYVCAGRAKWHTKSVWVGLGPKTKAECTVDVMIIDVAKEEIILDNKNVTADSTRKEAGLETAGALLLSMGITTLSGGPKTPHQQRSAILAIGDAMAPFVRTIAPATKKIGGGG